MREKKGILIVVSGFSGAGKGTLMKKLMQDYDNYALSISATTRQPRVGEEDGREYFFRTKEEFEKLNVFGTGTANTAYAKYFIGTKEEFEKMIARDELIEYARYVENYYGTPKQYVMEQLEAGKDVILEIEIQGALKVKEKYPDTLLMFVTPPSAQVLKDRLVGRGTETAEVIDSRMKRAVEESQGVEKYDYLVINDDLERCAKEMHSIIQGEHDRVSRNADFIDDIRKELKEL